MFPACTLWILASSCWLLMLFTLSTMAMVEWQGVHLYCWKWMKFRRCSTFWMHKNNDNQKLALYPVDTQSHFLPNWTRPEYLIRSFHMLCCWIDLWLISIYRFRIEFIFFFNRQTSISIIDYPVFSVQFITLLDFLVFFSFPNIPAVQASLLWLFQSFWCNQYNFFFLDSFSKLYFIFFLFANGFNFVRSRKSVSIPISNSVWNQIGTVWF